MRPTRRTKPQPDDWARIRREAGLLDQLSVAAPLELIKHGGIGLRIQQVQPFLALITTAPGGKTDYYDYRYWVRRSNTTKIPDWWGAGGEDEFEASVDTAYAPVLAVNLAERWKDGASWIGTHLALEGTAVMVYPTKDVYGHPGFVFWYEVGRVMRAKITSIAGTIEGKILRADDTEYPAGYALNTAVTITVDGRGPGGLDGLFPPIRVNDILFVIRWGGTAKWYLVPWWSKMGACP